MTADRGFIDMLLHEARVAATLSHPNIVQTIDVGQVDGNYFIALEHVHGEDLRSIVRQMKKKGVTQFPFEHAIAIVLGMCAGLSYAHERRDLDGSPLNIVHRDVSPQNIIVGFAGDVKIVDFGVAKSGTQNGEITKSGQLKGKVPYMSPEQARGEEVDWRSDVFATGVMLFELTTGKRLFKGPTEFETLKLIIDRDYPRPSWVASGYPPALEAIVMRALEKDRDKRYQSAREMQADLEAYVRDEKLPVSSIALAEFMKMLFEEKLAAQKEALMQGRQLADIIAAEVNHQSEHTVNTGIDSARPSFTSLSTSGAGSIAIGMPPSPPASRGGGAKWALIAIPIAAAAAFGAILLTRKPADSGAASASPTAKVEPAKARCSLLIDSDPPKAHIWLNGESRSEVTPATIDDLAVGSVDVKVALDGYGTTTDKVDLVSGTTAKRIFRLTKGLAKFQVNGAPSNATATLDGKPVKLPTFEASGGEEHTLVITGGIGYQPKTLKISGDVDQLRACDGSLDKMTSGGGLAIRPVPVPGGASTAAAPPPSGSGKIMVSASGGWCNASVDGRALGPTPTGAVDVSAGSHSITCVDSNGKAMSQGAKVNAGETSRVKFTIAG